MVKEEKVFELKSMEKMTKLMELGKKYYCFPNISEILPKGNGYSWGCDF
jgi:hypothetical protein